MDDPTERMKREYPFLLSLFPGGALEQAVALENALEPDPDADPITRIDQEWIKESRRYTTMNAAGVSLPPDRGRLISVLLLATLLGPIGLILGIMLDTGGLVCFNGFLSLVFFVPMLLALRHANMYRAAARAYRQRRAAALARLGRFDEAIAPLPMVDVPVWMGKGVLDLEAAITQLHDEYGVNGMGAQEYARSQAALLAAAPAADRPFFAALNQLERDWASDRQRLVRSMARHGRRRQVVPTVDAAQRQLRDGVITAILMTMILTAVGAPPFLVIGPVLLSGMLLYGAWSQHRRATRYARTLAAYRQRRTELLARHRGEWHALLTREEQERGQQRAEGERR